MSLNPVYLVIITAGGNELLRFVHADEGTANFLAGEITQEFYDVAGIDHLDYSVTAVSFVSCLVEGQFLESVRRMTRGPAGDALLAKARGE